MSKNLPKNDWEELVGSILSEQNDPPAFLLPKITSAIARRRRFWAGLEVFGSLALSLASVAGLIWAGQELVGQLMRAGTFTILSLIFSDFMVVIANWQAFALSLVESLPVLPAILTLGGAGLALISFKFMFDNLPKLNWQPNFRNNLNY